MIKKLTTLLLSALLFFTICIPVSVGATTTDEASVTNNIPIVDVTDSITISRASLPTSTTYTHEASNSLCWGGRNLNKTVHLNVSENISEGTHLEFWVYATKASASAFGLAMFSDNASTSCTDYYDELIEVPNQGWNLISVPLADFNVVHTPRGFTSIDHIELWPVYGARSVDPTVELYFDSMYVREGTSIEEVDTGLPIVGDLTTQAGIAASGASGNSSTNFSVVLAPEKTTYAIHLTDNKSAYQQSQNSNASTLSFLNSSAFATTDFRAYNTIELSIYSEYASGDTLRFVLWSDDSVRAGNDYYYSDILLDWTGWRNVQIQLGAMSVAGVPLGKDQIQQILFWWYEADKSINSGIYLDGMTLKNVDYDDRWKEPIYLTEAPAVDNQYDVAAKIKSLYPNNQHPRLLATQTEIDWIKNNYQTDEYLSTAVSTFLNVYCEDYRRTTPSFTATDDAASQAAALALGYHLTGNKLYADACWRNILMLTKQASTWTPGGSNLSLGDTARSVAVTYDLMYNFWTEEQRMIARNGMILFALEPMRANLLRINGGDNQATNWNPIINSGLGMCALAIADTPGYEGATNQYINRLHLALRNCFQHFGPDGSAFEGPDYWEYMMGNYMAYEKALYNSVKNANDATDMTDYFAFSMLDEFGMENSAEYMEHMHGTTKLSFNYYDGRARSCYVPGDFWMAKLFNKPEQAGLIYESKRATTYGILLYEPDLDYSDWRSKMSLDAAYTQGETQAGAMRTSWAKDNLGFYVGYKGNNQNVATHGRLDAGSFVLDALGKRWVSLLSNESYDLSGMFGSQRYEYYRNRAEGSNTLVIGPGVHQGTNLTNDNQAKVESLLDQKNRSVAMIETAKTATNAAKGAYSIVNLTDAYSATASKAKRGFALVDNRNAFLLQDEIDVKSTYDIYSFLHMSTNVSVTVAADGQSATLTQGTDSLNVKLLSNCGATLELQSAAPFSTSPDVENTANTGYRKLAVKAEDVTTSGTFALLITPANSSYTINSIVPLSQWDSFLE